MLSKAAYYSAMKNLYWRKNKFKYNYYQQLLFHQGLQRMEHCSFGKGFIFQEVLTFGRVSPVGGFLKTIEKYTYIHG